MKVVIAKVHENVFAGEAESLSVPTTDGVVTILGHHEPLVSIVVPGIAKVTSKGAAQEFAVTAGVLEVSNNQATVLL